LSLSEWKWFHERAAQCWTLESGKV
jgi:hypothetical protein